MNLKGVRTYKRGEKPAFETIADAYKEGLP